MRCLNYTSPCAQDGFESDGNVLDDRLDERRNMHLQASTSHSKPEKVSRASLNTQRSPLQGRLRQATFGNGGLTLHSPGQAVRLGNHTFSTAHETVGVVNAVTLSDEAGHLHRQPRGTERPAMPAASEGMPILLKRPFNLHLGQKTVEQIVHTTSYYYYYY